MLDMLKAMGFPIFKYITFIVRKIHDSYMTFDSNCPMIHESLVCYEYRYRQNNLQLLCWLCLAHGVEKRLKNLCINLYREINLTLRILKSS
jgi:hypothetical protein